MKISKISLRYLLLSFLVFCLLYISGCDEKAMTKTPKGTSGDTTRRDTQPSMMAPRDTLIKRTDSL